MQTGTSDCILICVLLPLLCRRGKGQGQGRKRPSQNRSSKRLTRDDGDGDSEPGSGTLLQIVSSTCMPAGAVCRHMASALQHFRCCDCMTAAATWGQVALLSSVPQQYAGLRCCNSKTGWLQPTCSLLTQSVAASCMSAVRVRQARLHFLLQPVLELKASCRL